MTLPRSAMRPSAAAVKSSVRSGVSWHCSIAAALTSSHDTGPRVVVTVPAFAPVPNVVCVDDATAGSRSKTAPGLRLSPKLDEVDRNRPRHEIEHRHAHGLDFGVADCGSSRN